MGSHKHYCLLLDKKGNEVKERSNTDGSSGHSEQRVLRNQPITSTSGGTLIVVRTAMCKTHKQWWIEERDSKPCNECMRHIKRAKIKNIIYTSSEGNGSWIHERLHY